MKYSVRILGIIFVVAMVGTGAISATTITGVVHNGTTGKVGVGVDIILLNLQNGMDSVATTKTDSEGRFQLNYTPAGQTPMLVRASYKGVNYHAMLPPGQVTADVQIYEPEADPKTVQIPSRIVYFQPDGSNLLVGEEYSIQNQTKPPVSYFKVTGDFEFQIPENANLEEINAAGPEGMSVVQSSIDRGNKRYAIAFPFRPGESRIRLSFSLPYPSNHVSIHIPSDNSTGSVMLLAPPTVTISGGGFQPGGTEQGLSVYVHDGPVATTGFDLSVSGTAPPPDNSGQAGQDSGGGSSRDRDSGAAVTAVNPRIWFNGLNWYLIVAVALLFLLGAIYLYRRPFALAGGAANAQTPAVASRSRGDAAATRPAANPSTSQPATPVAPVAGGGDALGEIDRKVGASLDELKDLLFRLELRRQAGTISEEDYTEQRARAEKILRDLVRG
jgi:hypothetical protein